MKFNPILPLDALTIIAIIGACFIAVMIFEHQKWDSILRRSLILVLLITLLLRPMIASPAIETAGTLQNVYFALDMTNSMQEKNCELEGRKVACFEKAKQDILDIAKLHKNAEFAVLAQDYESYSAVPLSKQQSLPENLLAVNMTDAELQSDDSINDLLDYSLNYIQQNSEAKPDRQNILYILSDGEAITPDKLKHPYFQADKKRTQGQDSGRNFIEEVIEEAVRGDGHQEAKKIDPAFIVDDGAILSYDVADKTEDSKGLETLARRSKLPLHAFGSARIEASKLAELIKQDDANQTTQVVYRESYHIIAIFLAIVLFWEYSESINNYLRERKAVRR